MVRPYPTPRRVPELPLCAAGREVSQPTLPVDRPHDLPPRWDGRAVVWDGWKSRDADGVLFICPPPRPQCCLACGSFTPPVSNRGRLALSARTTHQDIIDNNEARSRLPDSVKWKAHASRGPIALYQLTAFRCPDCRFDQVLDGDGQMWDLDESDYGDSGSIAPNSLPRA